MDWQPIETAPKHRFVLVFDPAAPYEDAVCIAQHYTGAWQRKPYFKTIRPTHWMPLPKPPGDE